MPMQNHLIVIEVTLHHIPSERIPGQLDPAGDDSIPESIEKCVSWVLQLIVRV